ncbi:MAG: ATP/maltotriose-dependent transcriptional regulator MalT [Myxococcota bacterium]|jgi:ATP/maltotriose-dependent transcriptional regulator MalT
MSEALRLLEKAEAANEHRATRGGRLAEQALTAAIREDELPLGLRAILLASKIRKSRGDITGCIALRERGVVWLLEARPTLESTLQHGVVLFLYWASGNINNLRGSFDDILERIDAMEALLDAAELSHRRDGLAYIRAMLCSNRDDLKGALSSISEAIELKEAHPNYGWGFSMESYQRIRVSWLRQLGRREEAEAGIQAMLRVERDQGRRVELLCMLARCAHDAGDLDLARQRIGEALQVAALGGLEIEKHCLGASVDIYRACGDFDEARRWAERYLDLVETTGRRFYLSMALEDVISTALDQGDLAAARRFLDRAIPLAHEVDEGRGATVRVPIVEEQEARLAELEAD